MTLMESCESYWADTVIRSGLNHEQLEVEFKRLLRAYEEPHRHYHTLRHLLELFELIELVTPFESSAADFPNIHWAIWYHDAVYDPRSNDNEERSAEWAERSLLEWGVVRDRVARVVSMIRETKHSGAEPSSPDAALFLDADLSILGADPERYDEYARAIRVEYEFVPDSAYRAGRSKVLRTFLDRPRIYRTDELHAARDQAARSNLRREIEQLGHV